MKHRPLFPKPYADFVARLRVPMGFVLVVAFAWLSVPTTESVAVGAAISLCGILLRGWAAGHLRKDKVLTASGPYAYIRNPLYVGTFTVAMGMAFAAQQVWLAALFAAVFLFVYLPAISLEEQHLHDLFPEFGEYVRRVPLLLPFRSPLPNERRFSFSQYIANREYEAFLAFLVGIVFLLAKAMYLS